MEHYFTEKPTSQEKITKININLKEDSFSIFSATGLFSKQELDKASQLLIERAQIKNNTKILDLGCGYGVIGLALLRKYDVEAVFSDVNERAVVITKKNLDYLKLKGNVIKSNLFENIKDKFDVIISNPPYAAGREICFSLIEESINYLNPEGTLQIVARHNKGGKTLSEKMFEVFGNVESVAKKSGFRVYLSRKNAKNVL